MLLPEANLSGLAGGKEDKERKIRLVGVKTVEEAFRLLFRSGQ